MLLLRKLFVVASLLCFCIAPVRENKRSLECSYTLTTHVSFVIVV